MAIGTPALVGSAITSTGASPQTLIVTVGAAGVAQDSIILIGASVNGASGATYTATDSKSNTYATDRLHDDNTGSVHIGVLSGKAATALVNGDTVSVTITGGGNPQRTVLVYSVTGLDTTTWLDQVNSGGATSTTPSSGNLITTLADELVFGFSSYKTAVGYAPGGSFAELDDTALGASASISVESEYRIVSSTGTYVADGTITSAVWVQIGATYKASTGGGGPPPATFGPALPTAARVSYTG